MTWVLFDLNGTLVDPSALSEPLMPDAFEDAIQLAMVTTMTGGRAAFRELIAAAVRRRIALAGRDSAEADPALAELAHMPAFPEARSALEIAAGGAHVGVLTQSSEDSSGQLLTNAGLRDAIELVISADDAGAFKPDPRVYRHALERVGEPTWLVAAHWWDTAGAARAGLRTAWVSRHDRLYPDAAPQPDVRAGDLLEAAEAISA